MGMNKKAGFQSGIGNAVGAGFNAVKGLGNAAIGAGQFVYNTAGQIVDASGKAIKAKVNQAGKVIDATGKVLGDLANQGAQYVGGLANEAKAGFANTQKGGTMAGTINPMTGLAEAASPVTQPIANTMVAGYDAVKGAVGRVGDAATMAAQVAKMTPAQLTQMKKFLRNMVYS